MRTITSTANMEASAAMDAILAALPTARRIAGQNERGEDVAAEDMLRVYGEPGALTIMVQDGLTVAAVRAALGGA
jgi:hypothetical protein